MIDKVTPGIFGSSNPWVLDRARGTKCCILDIDRGEIHLNNSEDDVEAWDGSITSFERAWVAKLVSVVRHHESDEDRNRDFVGSDAWVIGATALYLVELLSTASRVVSGHSESWASEQRRRYEKRFFTVQDGFVNGLQVTCMFTFLAPYNAVKLIAHYAGSLAGLPSTMEISCPSLNPTPLQHRLGCKAAYLTLSEPHRQRSVVSFSR